MREGAETQKKSDLPRNRARRRHQRCLEQKTSARSRWQLVDQTTPAEVRAKGAGARCFASIQDDLARLATEPGPGRRTERIRGVLAELDDALALGDDILRELRLLLSPKHQKSLTRA
jgi:hypothetical protein